jgi:hypothetical protein
MKRLLSDSVKAATREGGEFLNRDLDAEEMELPGQ